MAGNAGFGHDPLAPGFYSQLLFGDEIEISDGRFGNFTSSFLCVDDGDDDDDKRSNLNTPKMLCFGDYVNGKKTGQKSGFTCMESSPKSIEKKRNGSGIQNPVNRTGAPTGNRMNRKKPKLEISSGGGHAKVVKKEKLGERITALQQLVSPFGKTDTASVLHEALGYIKFLHDQVQVLCSPYMQRRSIPTSEALDTSDCKKSERSEDDLRSRGLCLVPVDLTLHVADSNGADLWSSAAMINTVSSS